MLKGSGRLQGTLPLKNSPFLTATVLAISAKYCFPKGLDMFFTESIVLLAPQNSVPLLPSLIRLPRPIPFSLQRNARFLKITPTKHNGFETKT